VCVCVCVCVKYLFLLEIFFHIYTSQGAFSSNFSFKKQYIKAEYNYCHYVLKKRVFFHGSGSPRLNRRIASHWTWICERSANFHWLVRFTAVVSNHSQSFRDFDGLQ